MKPNIKRLQKTEIRHSGRKHKLLAKATLFLAIRMKDSLYPIFRIRQQMEPSFLWGLFHRTDYFFQNCSAIVAKSLPK